MQAQLWGLVADDNPGMLSVSGVSCGHSLRLDSILPVNRTIPQRYMAIGNRFRSDGLKSDLAFTRVCISLTNACSSCLAAPRYVSSRTFACRLPLSFILTSTPPLPPSVPQRITLFIKLLLF